MLLTLFAALAALGGAWAQGVLAGVGIAAHDRRVRAAAPRPTLRAA